jgi:NADH dehydrogenase
MRGGEDTAETVDRAGNRHLIDAAKAAGVKEFLFVSALGADVHHPLPFIQAKAQTEAYLRDSGMPFTILAPNAFMEPWVGMIVGGPVGAGQPVTLVGEGRRRHTFIAMEDVAAFATAAIGHAAARNRYLPLGGPEALSWRDILATFERVLGRAIPVRSVAPGEPVPGMPEFVGHLMAAMESYETPLEMAETARTFGVRQTTLEEFVRQAFGGVRE